MCLFMCFPTSLFLTVMFVRSAFFFLELLRNCFIEGPMDHKLDFYLCQVFLFSPHSGLLLSSPLLVFILNPEPCAH